MGRTKLTKAKNLKPIRQRATLKPPSYFFFWFQQEQSQAENVRWKKKIFSKDLQMKIVSALKSRRRQR